MEELVIVPYLINGLGNRMFIYAAAYGVARKYNRKLITLSCQIEDSSHITTSYDFFFGKPQEKGEYWFTFLSDSSYFGEELGPRHYLLKGYFQSNILWKEYEEEIRQKWQCPLDIQIILRQKYRPENAIFIHIRRGDKVGERYEVDLDFYYAICLEKKITSAADRVFVFSDDPEWCETYHVLRPYNFIIVREDEVQSLFLMSLCEKGGICSNSTFSIWGGFLGGKVCYFPSLIEKDLISYKSLIPDNFQVIDTLTGEEIEPADIYFGRGF